MTLETPFTLTMAASTPQGSSVQTQSFASAESLAEWYAVQKARRGEVPEWETRPVSRRRRPARSQAHGADANRRRRDDFLVPL